jgi:hypothetical protein
MRIRAPEAAGKSLSRGLRLARPDPAQGLPKFLTKLGPGQQMGACRTRRLWGLQELSRMKLFTGYLAAGLVLLAGGAQAQVSGPHAGGRSPYIAASDFDAPYAVAPRPVPGPYYGAGPQDGYGPSLLPSTEVYAVLRDNGFSPLGIPRLRGFVYTIAVIDRGGEDGRLTIDARNGRIIRFVPSDRIDGGGFFEEQSSLRAPLPVSPLARVDGEARLPRSAPHVASRAVPVPKPSPLASKQGSGPGKPAPIKQAAAPVPKPVEAQAAEPITTGSAAEKPAAEVAPTQDMPKAQGLD